MAALSASASSESGWVTIGLVGWAFTNGVEAYWIIPGCLFGFLFNWFVLAARLRRGAAQTGALTLPDFFALHFRERWPLLRVLSVIVILVSMLLYVASLSASASSESGWVTLGLVGWAFTNGVQAYWIIPGCLIGFMFSWFFMAARMCERARELKARGVAGGKA